MPEKPWGQGQGGGLWLLRDGLPPHVGTVKKYLGLLPAVERGQEDTFLYHPHLDVRFRRTFPMHSLVHIFNEAC